MLTDCMTKIEIQCIVVSVETCIGSTIINLNDNKCRPTPSTSTSVISTNPEIIEEISDETDEHVLKKKKESTNSAVSLRPSSGSEITVLNPSPLTGGSRNMSLDKFFSFRSLVSLILIYCDEKMIANLFGSSYTSRMNLRDHGYYDAIQVFKLYYFHLQKTYQTFRPSKNQYVVVEQYRKEIIDHFCAIHDYRTVPFTKTSLDSLFFEDDSRYRYLRRVDETEENFFFKRLCSYVPFTLTIIESPRFSPYALAQLRVTVVQLTALCKDSVFSNGRIFKLYNLGMIHINDMLWLTKVRNLQQIIVKNCYELTYNNLRILRRNIHTHHLVRGGLRIFYEGDEVLNKTEFKVAGEGDLYVANCEAEDTRLLSKCSDVRLQRTKVFYSNLIELEKGKIPMSKHLLPEILVLDMRVMECIPPRAERYEKFMRWTKRNDNFHAEYVAYHEVHALSLDDRPVPSSRRRQHGISAYDHVSSESWELPATNTVFTMTVLLFYYETTINPNFNSFEWDGNQSSLDFRRDCKKIHSSGKKVNLYQLVMHVMKDHKKDQRESFGTPNSIDRVSRDNIYTPRLNLLPTAFRHMRYHQSTKKRTSIKCSMTSLLQGANENETYAINTHFGTDYESTDEDSEPLLGPKNKYPGPR